MKELDSQGQWLKAKGQELLSPTYICTQIPLPGTRFSNFIFASDNIPTAMPHNNWPTGTRAGAKRQSQQPNSSLYLLVCNLRPSGTLFFNFIFTSDNTPDINNNHVAQRPGSSAPGFPDCAAFAQSGMAVSPIFGLLGWRRSWLCLALRNSDVISDSTHNPVLCEM